MGALWDTKEHNFRWGYKIPQCIMGYILGEDGHKVEEICNIPSTNRWIDKSSQQDFGAASEGIQPTISEDLG